MAFWGSFRCSSCFKMYPGCFRNDPNGHQESCQDTPNGIQVQPKGSKSHPKGVHVEPMASKTHLGIVFNVFSNIWGVLWTVIARYMDR